MPATVSVPGAGRRGAGDGPGSPLGGRAPELRGQVLALVRSFEYSIGIVNESDRRP
jgi:hypothetical protein